MEKTRGWEEETLIKELNQGKELTMQLRDYLDQLASSPESCEFLIQKILSSYNKALSLLSLGDLVGELQQVADIFEPPQFVAAVAGLSPGSDGSGRELMDYCHRDVYKKRKTLPRWTEKVRVCSETGMDPLDDGYNWRKYGQKDILGAKFPRAYYRCKHRGLQGCLATKQVQRSDPNPSIFEITYQGRHTCMHSSPVITTSASARIEDDKENKYQSQPQLEEENQWEPQGGTELRVEPLEMGIMEERFPSFSFPSTPIESENIEMVNIFPETSESNFISVLTCPMDSFGGLSENLQHLESGLSEILSESASDANSSIGNLDFPLYQADFDPNFPFDTLEFFS
ncbi:WRKY Transcription Factor [Sarracenia purpurea var. burkii]